MKIAVLLFCIMACSILIRILEDKSVKNMNEAFVSMYNDRLIPAADLYYIAENVYSKEVLLENALLYTDSFLPENIGRQLQIHNAIIDSLTFKYEKTLLVGQEKEHLNALKNRLENSVGIEKKIVKVIDDQSFDEARKIYENEGRQILRSCTQKLSELIRIQTQVGQELIRDSEFIVSGSKIYSSMQVALAILIGILIVAIVFASNAVKIRNDKFNLN